LGSLQAVTLVMDLEDEFGVTVDDEEIEGLNTVGDIFRLIESKQQDQ
jgi:acyl carrier protein